MKVKEKEIIFVSLEDWQGAFEQSYATLADNSKAAIAQDLRHFVGWWEAENEDAFSPEKLTNWDLHAYRRHQLEIDRVSASTWNRRLSSLKRFADWAMAAGFVAMDPTTGVKSLQKEDSAPKWLSKQDFGRFMRQVEKNLNSANTAHRKHIALRDMAIVGLMAYAGLRESEVCNLHFSDIEINERSGSVLVQKTKWEKQRKVPLSIEARRLLSPWMETAQEVVFDVTARTIQKRVEKIAAQAGISVTPHQLRHTFAKRLVDAGVSIEKVQRLMGHSGMRSTLIYVKPGWSDLEDAVELI
jgi:integrase/recombinase XerC